MRSIHYRIGKFRPSKAINIMHIQKTCSHARNRPPDQAARSSLSVSGQKW